jgi:MoaA/NifB/PqqE/SkfB family radical SAM enzyme
VFTLQTYYSIGKALLTKKSPYYVQFYIIGKCNLRCRQCNIVETNSRISGMSLDEIAQVAKNLRAIGGGIVLLTGGEPFMHPKLPEIVEIFTREKLNVRLQTAGTKYPTEDKLRRCYEAGARDINVSVDSLDLRTGDYINAMPGSALNAFNTIETISRIFKKKSAILSFGTVLSQFNYREIPAIIEFAKKIGWYVSLVPVHIAPKDLPRGFRSFDDQFKFHENQYRELDQLADKLIKLKRAGDPLFDSETFIRSSMSFLKNGTPTWRKNGRCDSPDLYFAVRPNGEFTTCCDYTLKNAPKLQDPDFVLKYKSGEIRNRPDVESIVKNCHGCHYGSYPEVTISVRDYSAFIERSLLTLRYGNNKLKKATVQEGFVAALEKVKSEYPSVYPIGSWLRPDLYERINAWQTSEGMRKLILEDQSIRAEQNRVRGQGLEPVFPTN